MDHWLQFIYLSGPIGSTGGDGKAWRERASEALIQEFGIGTFSPAGAFTVRDSKGRDDRVSDAVFRINEMAIACSDAVLCFLPPDRPSLGSVREIQMARDADKPVILVCDHAHLSHFMYDLYVVGSLGDAYKQVRDWKLKERHEV